MKITLICGSIAQKSHIFAFLKYIEQLLKNKGIETSGITLSLQNDFSQTKR